MTIHPGAIGTATTGATAAAGFLAKATPLLQAVSLAVSILVGAVTFVWWVLKIRKELK